MVSYISARTQTEPRGEKTTNKATVLRLQKQKTAVCKGNFGCPYVPPAQFLSRGLVLKRKREKQRQRDRLSG